MTATLELELGGVPLQGVPSLRGPVFSGPLDVLLAIVRRQGYPLDRLPLGEITRQFAMYMEQNREQIEREEIELAAGFFETASWLVLLKSRALLPGESREADPIEELRQTLVAREIAQDEVAQWSGWLAEGLDPAGWVSGRGNGQRLAIQASAEAATEVPSSKIDTSTPQKAPTLHDAVVSARRALAAARAHASAVAATEAGVAMADVLTALNARLDRLAPGAIVSTAPWFAALDRESASVLLLALLELARLGTLWVYQAAPTATLWVQKPAHPRQRETEGKRQSASRRSKQLKRGQAS